MVALGNEGVFGAAGIERFKFLDEPVTEVHVMGKLREGQRAIPGTDLAVKDRAWAVLVWTGNKVLGKSLADLLGRTARRPVAEVVLLRCRGHCCGGQKQS